MRLQHCSKKFAGNTHWISRSINGPTTKRRYRASRLRVLLRAKNCGSQCWIKLLVFYPPNEAYSDCTDQAEYNCQNKQELKTNDRHTPLSECVDQWTPDHRGNYLGQRERGIPNAHIPRVVSARWQYICDKSPVNALIGTTGDAKESSSDEDHR